MTLFAHNSFYKNAIFTNFAFTKKQFSQKFYLLFQLQDCAGVTGKNCFQSNRGNESYWCAIAGAQSQTTTGDYTYVSYEQSLWNGKSYDDYNAITVNYNQTLEGPYKIGPERAIHCPDGNPSESYHPYNGYN